MKVILTFVVLAALFNASYAWFYTSGRKLMDSNGKEFIIRGINTASADWDATYKPESYMPAIAATGANAVRIQWLTDDKVKEKGLTDNNLKNVIQQAINNKLIPILELWSFTGSNDYNALKTAGNWWVSKMNILKPFEDKLLINIANEWSDWKKGRDDQAGHKLMDILWYADTAIAPIRKAGWQGTLIVDSTAYAQSPNAILKYGSELINRDPKKNILFSLHLYADWREASSYDQSIFTYI